MWHYSHRLDLGSGGGGFLANTGVTRVHPFPETVSDGRGRWRGPAASQPASPAGFVSVLPPQRQLLLPGPLSSGAAAWPTPFWRFGGGGSKGDPQFAAPLPWEQDGAPCPGRHLQDGKRAARGTNHSGAWTYPGYFTSGGKIKYV